MALNLLWLLSSRLFQAGLALKIVLILLLVPQIHESSFVPFLQFLARNPNIDPWTRFLDAGGNLLSYSCGPVMLAVHLPGVIAGMTIDAIAGTDIFAYFGLRAGLLVVDFLAFALLCQIFRKQYRKVIIFYWYSPIILFATYWVGQTDIVTVALIILSILFMKGNRTLDAGWALGLASAANLIITATLPFVAIYFWRNKRLRHLIAPFIGGFAAVSVALHAPLLLSPGFRRMALGSYEINWIYDLALPIGQSIEVYLTLVLYMLSLYAMWRLARINFDLLIAIIGLVFFVLVLVPPAPVSRYVWVVPFLVAYQLSTNRTNIVLVNGFSATIIGYHLLRAPGPRLTFLNQNLTDLIEPLKALITPHYLSLWMTVSIALGCILIVQILCEEVCRNDIFRLGMRPISVGISGDSGSGKDTLSLNLAELFGTHSVVHISGDNYHLWDRYAPMWKALTHLNPRANDLDRFRGDVLSLLNGRGVVCRSYDHTVGRFSRPKLIKNNDVLIVSGLHTLYNETLAKHFDIKIYLDICEDLRLHWKIQRDVHQRGYPLEKVLATLERREQDSKQYIHPQKNRADLIFSLAPANMAHLQASPLPNSLRLKLKVLLRNSSYHERLAKILIGVCGLYLEMDDTGNGGEIIMEIEGDVEGSDLALAVHNFDPHLIQIFDLNPRWVDGMAGLMQMITLIHLDEAVRRRI